MGHVMVKTAIAISFERLGLEEITLAVFDFNEPAIRCYEAVGFERYDFKEAAVPFENERWNVVFMKQERWAAAPRDLPQPTD